MFELTLVVVPAGLPIAAAAQPEERPDILVIWGDDIGTTNNAEDERENIGSTSPAGRCCRASWTATATS